MKYQNNKLLNLSISLPDSVNKIPDEIVNEFEAAISNNNLQIAEKCLSNYPQLSSHLFLNSKKSALSHAIDANAYMIVFLLLKFKADTSFLTQAEREYLENLQKNIEGRVPKYIFINSVMKINPLYMAGTVGLDHFPSHRVN